jgi:hypothetical protein
MPIDDIDMVFRQAGFEKVPAWVRRPASSSGERRRSANAERKAQQRAAAHRAGWQQCNVAAPADPDARRLLTEIARAIVDRRVRTAIEIALRDPELVFG